MIGNDDDDDATIFWMVVVIRLDELQMRGVAANAVVGFVVFVVVVVVDMVAVTVLDRNIRSVGTSSS